jgi:hypothetical protein
MSAWVPALHAGRTKWKGLPGLTEALQRGIFKGERAARRKNSRAKTQKRAKVPQVPLFPPLSKGDERGFLDFLVSWLDKSC